MRKLTKPQLRKMLSSFNLSVKEPSGSIGLDKATSIEEYLDVIFEEISLKSGVFSMEYLLRENFGIYMEKYPVYTSMQQGLKSELLTRLHGNDVDRLIIVSDSVIRGSASLFALYCTDDRSSILSFIDALHYRLDVLIKQFDTKKVNKPEHMYDGTEESCYVAVTKLCNILRHH